MERTYVMKFSGGDGVTTTCTTEVEDPADALKQGLSRVRAQPENFTWQNQEKTHAAEAPEASTIRCMEVAEMGEESDDDASRSC